MGRRGRRRGGGKAAGCLGRDAGCGALSPGGTGREKSAKDRESQVGPELQRVASRKELDGLRDGLRPQALEDGERERTVGERRGRRGAHPAVAAWLGEVGALPEMPVDLESLRTTLDPFTGGIGISGE